MPVQNLKQFHPKKNGPIALGGKACGGMSPALVKSLLWTDPFGRYGYGQKAFPTRKRLQPSLSGFQATARLAQEGEVV